MGRSWENHGPGSTHYSLEQKSVPCRKTTTTIVAVAAAAAATIPATTSTTSTHSYHQLNLFVLGSVANSSQHPSSGILSSPFCRKGLHNWISIARKWKRQDSNQDHQTPKPTNCPVSHTASAETVRLKWKLRLSHALRRVWELTWIKGQIIVRALPPAHWIPGC